MKNTHYFPHPANLRNDRRMKRAMKDLPGGVGYGAIVLLLEVLRCEPDYRYPMCDLDILAGDLGISLPILQTVISSYDFFIIEKNEKEEIFISPILNELMLPYDNKKKQNSIAGKISAEKRKLKQKEQLKLLSQLDSSQHMLDTCQTPAEQNRREEKRKEKKRENLSYSYFSDFKNFKNFIIKKYKSRMLCFGPANFLASTSISLSHTGHLHNDTTYRDLSPDDAIKVWKWMFDNQDKLVIKR